jgi:hypothetical protein
MSPCSGFPRVIPSIISQKSSPITKRGGETLHYSEGAVPPCFRAEGFGERSLASVLKPWHSSYHPAKNLRPRGPKGILRNSAEFQTNRQMVLELKSFSTNPSGRQSRQAPKPAQTGGTRITVRSISPPVARDSLPYEPPSQAQCSTRRTGNTVAEWFRISERILSEALGTGSVKPRREPSLDNLRIRLRHQATSRRLFW